jgi:hypothetical protein
MKVLTDKTLEAAKPQAKRYPIHDSRTQGLQLIVYPSGKKTWVWRGKVCGQTQKHTLGAYPANGLADAREWAAGLIRQRDGGHDPRAERQRVLADIQANAAREQMTVSRAFDIYMEREGSSRKSAAEKRRMFKRDVEPVLGSKPLADVTHDDLDGLLLAKLNAGAPIASNALQCLLARFCR